MLDREALLTGTRPEITGGKIIMTGAPSLDGYEVMEYLGMCWGISMRSKDMGQDCAMGIKQMTGGELSSYTQLGDEARQKAIQRMLEMAGRMGANAIINVEFELSSMGNTMTVANGTGVFIRPVTNYVPEGAIGNILAEMHDLLEGRGDRG
jgi:uncharacterized protein YbjQ (UPF0145 family)